MTNTPRVRSPTTMTSTQSPTQAAAQLRVREIPFDAVDSDFAQRWRQLEARSIEGNAFCSPDFVVPAINLLSDPVRQPFLVAVESDTNALLGLGVFEECRGSRLLPLTHLRNWQSDYSMFDGLLVDRDFADQALISLFEFLSRDRRWHGLAFENRSTNSRLSDALRCAAEAGRVVWHEDWSVERAVVPVDQVPDDCLGELYSKSRRKTLKRNRRRLESYGSVEFRLHQPAPGDSQTVEEFLRLESLGWKGEQGTAMATVANHSQFCRELVTGFAAAGRVVFGELTVAGRPVASSLNLLSAGTLFAFKIGWDPQFAECSPGTLCELSLLEHCREILGVEQIDSCAKPGSYVEHVWPWRGKLTTGVFTTSMTGTLAASALGRVKQLQRLLNRADS